LGEKRERSLPGSLNPLLDFENRRWAGITRTHKRGAKLNPRDKVRSRLAQEGLIVDRETANLAVKRWLREVANARIHGTTSAVPAERLVSERLQLQPIPALYGGRSVRALQATSEPPPIIGVQHPLSLYDAFAGGAP
jgi:hypothetical protein